MQQWSGQATERLSFAYKLRSPEDVVLKQYHTLSASNKDLKYAILDLCWLVMLDLLQGVTFSFTKMHQDCLTCRYSMTAGELMRRFDQSHVSINDRVTVCVHCSTIVLD